jgi:acyl-CoA reductase-like NAD-dependent aldehyde dehydrogenase
VVGAIVAWNFPLLLASWKVAPALAAGNTVVLKPAEFTPLSVLLLAECAKEAGLPDGVLNVIPGKGSIAGQALVEHPDVAKIAFTGSTEVGKGILRTAADRVAKVTMELGGKSANIVFADANLDDAVRGAANGIFYGKGEICAAGSRLLVERGDLLRRRRPAQGARREVAGRRSHAPEDAAGRARARRPDEPRARLHRQGQGRRARRSSPAASASRSTARATSCRRRSSPTCATT